MTRLHTELQRLFRPADAHPASTGHDAPANPPPEHLPALLDAQGRTRALVLELLRPVDTTALATLWQGAQADLGLPAPGVAVSGQDGLQLWWSLQQAVDLATARQLLQGLQARYLPDLPARRVALWPAPADTPGAAPRHTALVPADQGSSGRWSAFVAPDLAPVFADDPWLDGAPNPDGQAELLARLASISPAALADALQRLQPAPAGAAAAAPTAAAAIAPASATTGASTTAYPCDDPAAFLRAVMNDVGAPLALRVDAAKALLQRN